MASRQEEKEKRRRERIAREQAEARAAGRRKRLQMALGVLVGAAAVVGIVVAIMAAGGGDDGGGDARQASDTGLPTLPEQRTSDLDEAADRAGCEVINARYEGKNHEDREFKASDFKTNPPTSGTHTPVWAEDGVYEADSLPPLGQLVHTLEHGRIDVQYKDGTPQQTVRKLEALLKENNDGYHMLLFPNPTGMKYQVAATAWTHILGCERFTDDAIDALRAFRSRYIDKGPEQVP